MHKWFQNGSLDIISFTIHVKNESIIITKFTSRLIWSNLATRHFPTLWIKMQSFFFFANKSGALLNSGKHLIFPDINPRFEIAIQVSQSGARLNSARIIAFLRNCHCSQYDVKGYISRIRSDAWKNRDMIVTCHLLFYSAKWANGYLSPRFRGIYYCRFSKVRLWQCACSLRELSIIRLRRRIQK